MNCIAFPEICLLLTLSQQVNNGPLVTKEHTLVTRWSCRPYFVENKIATDRYPRICYAAHLNFTPPLAHPERWLITVLPLPLYYTECSQLLTISLGVYRSQTGLGLNIGLGLAALVLVNILVFLPTLSSLQCKEVDE